MSTKPAAGQFVIDQIRNVAWALEYSESESKSDTTLWAVLQTEDTVPIRVIGAWLQANKLSWNRVTAFPLPPDVYQVYASSEVAEPKQKANSYADISGKTILNIKPVDKKAAELSPVALFKMLSPSIFIVHAKRSNGDEFQGSAVAVSPHILLTNCHVVDGAADIELTKEGEHFGVILISGDVKADRCILQTPSQITNYVAIRPYDELEIGEKAYSIGAPLGLELTLSDGLLSGKRALSGTRLIQTTAPISPGSSGGGLFDAYGNLIGITTFHFKESENLNFAIAAQDYLK